MAKSRKSLAFFSGLLIFGLGVGGTYAVFHFTDVPSMLISDLHKTVVAEEDPSVLRDIESTQKDHEKEVSEAKRLKRENDSLSEEVRLKEEEVKEKQERLSKERAAVRPSPKNTHSEVKKRQGIARRRVLSKQLQNIQAVEPILDQLRDQLEVVGKVTSELEGYKNELQLLHESVEAKLLNFRKGLATKSNHKEFWLYIFGLKLLWGIFTGYARTFYPYAEEAQLNQELELLKKNEPVLLSSIEQSKEKLHQEVQTLRSILKRAELTMAFNSQAQAVFVSEVTLPLLDQLGDFESALEEQMRTQEVVHEFIKSYLESKDYVPYFDPVAEPYYARDTWEQIRRNRHYEVSALAKEHFTASSTALTTSIVNSVQTLRVFAYEVLKKADIMRDLGTLSPTTSTRTKS